MDHNAQSQNPPGETFEIQELDLEKVAGGDAGQSCGSCGGACAKCRDGQSG